MAHGQTLRLLVLLVTSSGLVSSVPDQVSVHYSLEEESVDPGSLIADLKQDPAIQSRYSSAELDQIRFHFLSDPPSVMTVGNSSGEIRTSGRVDRDQLCPSANLCQIQFDLFTQPAQLFLIVKVTVDVLDINDNGPQFDVSDVTKWLSESMTIGDSIILARVHDPDSPRFFRNRTVVLEPSDMRQLFGITSQQRAVDQDLELRLVLKKTLDRESRDAYTCRVVVHDGGDPSRSGTLSVTIRVQDVNDNGPEFQNATYEAVVPEHAPPGYPVIQVHAEDPDSGPSGHVTYRLSEESLAEHGESFSVDPQSGEVVVTGDLDHEVQRVITLSVEAVDGGPGPLTARTLLTVRLQDVNDHPPTVTVNTLQGPGLTRLTLPENATLGTFVARVSVADRDSGRNGDVNCSMDDASFELQPFEADFLVTSSAPLDRERQAEVTLSVICSDLGSPPQTTVTEIHVSLGDINDNSPSFLKSSYYRQVAENNPRGALLLQVSAQDPDEGINGQVVYSIHGNAAKLFEVDPVTGVVKAIVSLDREVAQEYVVPLMATDRGTPFRTGTTELVVMVTDVNDEAPVFSQQEYSFGVYENEAGGAEVGRLSAQDADGSQFDDVMYSVLSWRPLGKHSVDGEAPVQVVPTSGLLMTSRRLDRETHSGYELVVVAADVAEATLSSTATVSVYVLDRNDNRPEFRFPGSANGSVSVSPWAAVGLEVGRLEADDPDLGEAGRVRFSLSAASHPGLFRVEGDSGAVVVAAPLTALHNVTVLLTLAATDGGNPPLSSTRTLYVTVSRDVAVGVSPGVGGRYDDRDVPQHYVIVVAVACGSCVVILALVLAIVCVCCSQKRRRHQHRMRHLKVMAARDDGVLAPGESDTCSQTAPFPGHRAGLGPLTTPAHDTSSQRADYPNVPLTADVNLSNQCAPSPAGNLGNQKPSRVDLSLEKSRKWLETLQASNEVPRQPGAAPPAGVDSDSIQSAPGSTTDSGRGASELDPDTLPAYHLALHYPHLRDSRLSRPSYLGNDPRPGRQPSIPRLSSQQEEEAPPVPARGAGLEGRGPQVARVVPPSPGIRVQVGPQVLRYSVPFPGMLNSSTEDLADPERGRQGYSTFRPHPQRKDPHSGPTADPSLRSGSPDSPSPDDGDNYHGMVSGMPLRQNQRFNPDSGMKTPEHYAANAQLTPGREPVEEPGYHGDRRSPGGLRRQEMFRIPGVSPEAVVPDDYISHPEPHGTGPHVPQVPMVPQRVMPADRRSFQLDHPRSLHMRNPPLPADQVSYDLEDLQDSLRDLDKFSRESEDVASSTSGSYLVDPEELLQEIEGIVFSDVMV